MSEKKQQPARKLPKKSERAKRRYVLFGLKRGACGSAKQAFDLVMNQFSAAERKELGVWFIGFDAEKGLGIVRCRLGCVPKVREAVEGLSKEFSPVAVSTSGTLKALKARIGRMR